MAASRNRYFSGELSPPTVTDLLYEFTEFDLYNVNSSPEFRQSSPESKTRRKTVKNGAKTKTATAMSLPVDVPNWSMILKQTESNNNNKRRDNDFETESDLFDYGDDDVIVPPHEYLARERIASLSVHEGIGRTLKGRDLSRVRNAVWKQIGFED